jgi:hypothetical protein
MATSNERLAQLVKQLRQEPAIAEQLPNQEGTIVRDALAGQDVYTIAQQHQVSEQAVWDILSNAARAAAGRQAAQVETGGLDSDTDPGVTGGYGDTGFGSLGAEPPVPIPEEPSDKSKDKT